jgi:hypothetical protein
MVEQDQVYGEIARLTSERDHWYQRTMEQAFAKAEAMRDAAAQWDAACEACAKIPEGIARKEGWQVNSEPAWACAETAAECRALKGQGGK